MNGILLQQPELTDFVNSHYYTATQTHPRLYLITFSFHSY